MPFRTRRQALGQHFLKDQKIATLIVQRGLEEALKLSCKTLIEIGPGKGALTWPLLETLKLAPKNKSIQNILLFEKDIRFLNFWKSQHQLLSTACSIQIKEGDFLQWPPQEWLKYAPLAVISNLPYSAATAIFSILARYPQKIPILVLMFQAEVAKKLRAAPPSAHCGSLSVWTQNAWDVEKLIAVSPKAFSPPPRVDSEVVLLKARTEKHIPSINSPECEILWNKLLKVTFAHRRKMLRSGLPTTGPWRKALEHSQIDNTKRAEALNWEEWNRFFQAVLITSVENSP